MDFKTLLRGSSMLNTETEERLLLHEHTGAGGVLVATWLEERDGELFFTACTGPSDASRRLVPIAFLDAVMKRYGRPLADDVVLEGPQLRVHGRTLAKLRHLARYDVIAKDFLVVRGVADEPLVELSTSVSAALDYLLRDVPSQGA
jgi:hypothetical protein